MKKHHEPRVDELHVDRRIRRILAFQIIFVVILYIIVYTASSVFLGQQYRANTRIQSRFQMIVDIQNIEQLILKNGTLVQAYRTDASAANLEALAVNHTQFTELINKTQDRLDKTVPEEAADLAKEKELSEDLTQDYLKIISNTNALLGREVLSTIASFKFNAQAAKSLPQVTSDKSPEVIQTEMTSDSAHAITTSTEWRTLADRDISRLQGDLGLSQRYHSAILALQAILVIGGLLFLSYKYVLPAFEKILKQVMVQNEKLIKADSMKTEFLSIASHQLRTPLSVIKWSMSLLMKPDQGLTKNQQDMVAQAKSSADTVIKLVNNLLNLSRIEQGRLAYHPVATDVAPIINSIVHEVGAIAKAHNVTISANLPGTIQLIADPLLFKEVIQNLVDNAIAYNRPNGTVTVTARDMGKNWYFDVADTGMGIMPEDQRNLFTKFYRGMNARSVRPDGSGLGLYFIQKIAVLHGGIIKLESEPNQGTVFTVVIPKKAKEAHIHPEEHKMPEAEVAAPAPPEPSMQPPPAQSTLTPPTPSSAPAEQVVLESTNSTPTQPEPSGSNI